MLNLVDLTFPIVRRDQPSLSDGYALFGALCRGGFLAHAEPNVQVLLMRDALLIRCDSTWAVALASGLPRVLGLGGGKLVLDGWAVSPLRPFSSLGSAIVTIKGKLDAGSLLESCRKQLALIGVRGGVQVGDRRCLVVRDRKIVGYEVWVSGLTPPDSLSLQAHGLGGKQRMGCGVFVP